MSANATNLKDQGSVLARRLRISPFRSSHNGCTFVGGRQFPVGKSASVSRE